MGSPGDTLPSSPRHLEPFTLHALGCFRWHGCTISGAICSIVQWQTVYQRWYCRRGQTLDEDNLKYLYPRHSVIGIHGWQILWPMMPYGAGRSAVAYRRSTFRGLVCAAAKLGLTLRWLGEGAMAERLSMYSWWQRCCSKVGVWRQVFKNLGSLQ